MSKLSKLDQAILETRNKIAEQERVLATLLAFSGGDEPKPRSHRKRKLVAVSAEKESA